mmetsp:Transcript_4339/g.9759  ORF Transcript_4339/g.9759 Transcript_4339/m.9759 type:complete len:441 (+) Transcript_4339:172-1494(+)
MSMSREAREAEAWVDPASDGSNLCPLCCEADLSSPSLRVISLSCNHTSCAPCMATWVEKQECNGGPPSSLPGCPFCRAEICKDDAHCILGRPYQPKQPTITETLINEAEIDDLTRDWLDEHTMLCQGCGSRIEKESGCDLIECLCGWRFCYKCGQPGGTCGCNFGHGFLETEGWTSAAPLRDPNGVVNLRQCMHRKKIRREREQRCNAVEIELQRWDNPSEKTSNLCTWNGRWIFDCTSLSSSVRMLRGQLTYSTKNRMRAHMRAHRCSSRVSSSPVNSWLFLRGERAQARALRQLIDRDGVASKRRRIRSGKEYEDFERWENEHDLASIWLFLPSRVGLQMLQNMKSSLRRRYQRRGYDEHLVEDPGIDNFIHSGAWLFHCVARDETIAHLHRLHEHSRNGYDVADDREYAHWMQIDEYGSPSKMDEYNLGNILALFSE